MSEPEKKRPNLLQVFFSVVAAFFGVQTEKARLRDFSHGSPAPYIIVGIVLIVLMLLSVGFVVRTVLKVSGAI
ncbi:hypothetical protein CWE09_12945 [Aliidiomarina minuta]|uniref:DUF2970 domain-containing protein n=1 Tax=Aliidiomarina minuta TaxID=880057 RepID=A0A432W3V3_9GAMM|nr:DUF2970 domain-containing protein [Aliidiomarina minuta]RUO24045.1 hypothetical protein CWE09_12945 [Aliidiomarina minuta]